MGDVHRYPHTQACSDGEVAPGQHGEVMAPDRVGWKRRRCDDIRLARLLEVELDDRELAMRRVVAGWALPAERIRGDVGVELAVGRQQGMGVRATVGFDESNLPDPVSVRDVEDAQALFLE